MGAKANLTLTAWAVDNASGPLGQITAAAKKMPEGLSKAHAAMGALGGAAGELGGPIAGVTSKLTGLLGMVVSGGPLGLGIASLSVAASIGAVAWESYTAAARAVEAMGRSLDGVLAAQAKATADAAKQADELEKSLRNFGKTSQQVARDEFAMALEKSSNGAEVFRQEIDKLEAANRRMLDVQDKVSRMDGSILVTKREQLRATENERAQNDKMIATLKESAVQLEQKRASEERSLAAVEGLIAKTKQEEQATRRATLAKKDKAEADRDAARTLQDALKAEEDYARGISTSLAKAFGGQSDYYSRVADLQERDARAEDRLSQERVEREQEAVRQVAQTIGAVGAVWGDAFADMATGADSAGHAAGKAAVQSAETMIMAAAAAAAAKQMEAHSMIPFVGIAIGAAAAGVIFALIKAQMSNVPKAAHGGVVTGGRAGEDSVPIMAMPGEVILPVSVAQQFMAIANSPAGGGGGRVQHFAGGGRVAPRSRDHGGSMSVTAHFHSFMPPREVEQKRILRDMSRTWRRARESGQIDDLGSRGA